MRALLDEVAFRPITEDDYNFVLHSWHTSYKYSPWAGSIMNHRFPGVVKETIDELRARGMIIQMACVRDVPTQLLGFVAYEVGANGTYVVHYTYVKPDFRRSGVSKALFDNIGLTRPFLYSHRTQDCQYLKGGQHVASFARREKLEPVRKPRGTSEN